MEQFKRVVINNIETNYLIYNDGRCYSLTSKRFLKPKTTLKYDRYSLSVNNKVYDRYIHRLVAEYFVEKTNEAANEVNHIDGNTKNNHYSNLEWVTKSDNLKHQRENYLYERTKIKQYSLKGDFIREWNTCSQVEHELKISAKSVNNCCNRKQKNAGGFQWCYENEEESIIKSSEYNFKLRSQKVLMLDKDENIVEEFEKVSDVYVYFNKRDNGYITQVLKGKRKSAWGYKFQYKDI